MAAQQAEQLAAMRRVPQYEAGQQRLGGDRAVARSPDDVAAKRLQRLGRSTVHPKIARHIQAEEHRKAEVARKRGEEEARLATARANADLLRARQAAVPAADPGVTAAAAEARMTPNTLRQLIASVESEALGLLCRVVLNVIAQPERTKVRSLRRYNQKLRPLFADANALTVLHFVGFVEAQMDEENHGVLESFMVLPLAVGTERLQQVADVIGGGGGAPAGPSPPVAAARQPRGAAGSSGGPTQAPPDEIVCPITSEVMEEPVITGAGHTYERRAIEAWFERCRAAGRPLTDPKSGSALQSAVVVDNHAVRGMTATYRERQQSARLGQLEAAAAAVRATPADIAGAQPPPPPPSAHLVDPGEELFGPQMQQLADMGFQDRESCLHALVATDGNIEIAMGMLVVDAA